MARKGGTGGGGSQLSQLKARLHSDGVTDRRQMKASAKKRKRGMAASERDEQDARRDKLSRIASSAAFNPFEEKVTKPKNVVLGRRIRGATGKPGEARQGGLRERTEHLLPEWMNRNKSGSFVDRRFGEGAGGDMSVDDKMLERFTLERQRKANKASLFNLDDAAEEGLTHYGKSLNDMDTYDDINLSDEETGEDRMAHFGGFDDDVKEAGDEDRVKSKAEVMKEVIAKSKMHKQERQQTKMADDDLRQKLDDEFSDIRSLLMAPNVIPLPESAKKDEQAGEERPLFGADKRKEDAYDSAVREMIFERRAKPQDRLKTEAEMAQELADKLQRAEKDRLRRMRGEEIMDDEEGGRRKGTARIAGGDDLEDDFELDGMTASDVYGLGQGLGTSGDADEEDIEEEDASEVGDDRETDESDNDYGEDDESDNDDEDEGDDDEDDFGDLADADALAVEGEEIETDDGNQGQETIISKSGSTSAKLIDAAKVTPALPFTFPCPTTLDELQEILTVNKVSPDDVPVVIKRIRVLHHASLAEENKFKLQALIGVLIDYILNLSMYISAANKSSSMHIINALFPQVYALTKTYPIASSEHFVSKLALMHRNLTRGLSKGALDERARTWPGLAECILLKLTSAVWPTSDRAHAVTTPLALLIAQYLSGCRIRSLRDVGKGVFLTALVVDNERQSKRIVPEALNFLHNAISLLAPLTASKRQLARINNQFGIPWPDHDQPHAKALKLIETDDVDEEAAGSRVDVVFLLDTADAGDEALKQRLLAACFTLVDDFAQLYAGSVAYVELFLPFQMLLGEDTMRPKLTPSWLQAAKQSTLDRLTRRVANAQRQRRSLRLQAHRAVPISSHVPKFESGFNPERKGGRTFDPDSERAEMAKLRALAKKERKGAMRELRRDNEFLAEARRTEREQEDQRYAKTIDKIMGSLSAERGEEKAYLKEKQRIKRRSGKK